MYRVCVLAMVGYVDVEADNEIEAKVEAYKDNEFAHVCDVLAESDEPWSIKVMEKAEGPEELQ